LSTKISTLLYENYCLLNLHPSMTQISGGVYIGWICSHLEELWEFQWGHLSLEILQSQTICCLFCVWLRRADKYCKAFLGQQSKSIKPSWKNGDLNNLAVQPITEAIGPDFLGNSRSFLFEPIYYICPCLGYTLQKAKYQRHNGWSVNCKSLTFNYMLDWIFWNWNCLFFWKKVKHIVKSKGFVGKKQGKKQKKKIYISISKNLIFWWTNDGL